MIKKSDITAGLVDGATKDAGGTEEQQLQRAQLAASMVERAEADCAKRKAEDTLEPEAKWRRNTPADPRRDPSPPRRKPTQPPGPGMLSHIARFLNLK